jgi:nucleotide-binding universal stress UspA family protein
MIRNFLIGLDGSPYSEAAVELAIRWAGPAQATLTGIGVIDEPSIRALQTAGARASVARVMQTEERLKDAGSRVDRFLAQFTERCTQAGVPCRVLRQVGAPAERIDAAAEDFDLTLLGRRTYFHFATQSETDDTLLQVLRQSHRPVVAVGAHLPVSRSVMIAYDASPPAVRALEAFQKLPLANWQAIHVVSVAADLATAGRHAEEAARFLRSYQLPAEARPVAAARPSAGLLLEQASKLNAGMLVMGAFGRSEVKEAIFGSKTETILAQGEPLLFLHH